MDVDQSGVQKDNMYRCSDHSPIVTFLNLGNGSTGIETPTISRPAIRLTGDPRSGYLTLVSNTSLSRAEIVNISGQIIATYDISNAENAENRFTLPVNSLVRGFYLIRVYDAQGRVITTFCIFGMLMSYVAIICPTDIDDFGTAEAGVAY